MTPMYMDYDDEPYYFTYKKPYDDIDRVKWPNTWKLMVLFYHGGKWWTMTKWTPDRRAYEQKA